MRRLLCGMLLLLCSALVFAEDQMVIHGIVRDEFTNAPIANLGIYSDANSTKVTTTNDKGEFSYPVKPDETVIHILPYSNEIVGKSIFVDVAEFQHTVVNIVVERGMKLRVHVVDQHGAAVAHAAISWTGAGGCGGETDAQGNVTIGMVPRFREGFLTVTAPGYQEWQRSGVYAPLYAENGITVTLVTEARNQQ